MLTDYYPHRDSERVLWHNTFSSKLATYATQLDLTTTDVNGAKADALYLAYIIGFLESVLTYKQQLTAFKNILLNGINLGALPALVSGTAPAAVNAGIQKRTRSMVQRIKNHRNYTEAIGNDLGIIGSELSIDPDQLKPVLKITLDVGKPHIKWEKQNADSIHLYADHNDGRGYVFVANITRREYLDIIQTPAQPTVWKYKAIFVLNDEEVGLFSDEVKVTVSPLL